MPSKRGALVRRPVSPAAFAELKRSLERCTSRIEALERAIDTNIKRMGAMQAELDHLRATMKP